MKNILLLICLTAISMTTFAKENKTPKSSLMGTWKFSKKTVINDYEQVFKNTQIYQSEYYTFEANNVFKHDFFDKEGNLIRTLSGHWKFSDDKIHLKYTDVDFNITLNYHFTDFDNDLVFGKDFNHVILTKEVITADAVALN